MHEQRLVIPVWQLGRDHFERYPVWSWADNDDESLVSPTDQSMVPMIRDSLFLRATVCLGNGRNCRGSISVRCSDWSVYEVCVFIGNEEFSFHQILHDDQDRELSRMALYLKIDQRELFPLIYSADFVNPFSNAKLQGMVRRHCS